MMSPIKFCGALLIILSAVAHSQELAANSVAGGDETPAISALKLVGFNDAQDLVELQSLASGSTLDLAQFSVDELNIMAEVNDESTTGSVHFALSGPVSIDRWENNAIYTMEVETDNLNIRQQELPVGNYTLTVTPYAQADMEGPKGSASTVTFTVVDSKTISPSVPAIAAAELVAIDDATGMFNTIQRITEGSIINSADLNFERVNIVAVSENASKTGSVQFDLDGPAKIIRHENETAFTLADKSEHLQAAQGELPEGEYTLIITPFAEADAKGEAGVPLMLNFRVGDVEQSEEATTPSNGEQLVYDGSPANKTDNGFTVIRPSADSKLVYVSSSLGDDSNSCLSEASPCKSIKAGLEKMRDGYPDHIYLKRGDVWSHEQLFGLSSGRSAQEPAVLAYYGLTGARPKLESSGIVMHALQNKIANLHILGLEFSAAKVLSAETSDNAGIVLWGTNQNILFEDNKFSRMTVIVKAWKNAKPQNIHLRRNIWVDDAMATTHLAKLHIEGTSRLLIEENVFNYGNSKTANIADARPIALTIADASDSVTLRRNIIVGSSGGEGQLFPGAVTENNFIAAAIGTARFSAVMDAVSNRPLGFWNDRYSSSAMHIHKNAG